MKFSQYVLDAIRSVDCMSKNHDTASVALLREASEKAQSETDSHILDVVAGVATLSYKKDKCTFSPLVIWNDGSRSFALEDLETTDLDILREAIQVTGSTYLRTKFSHVVWLCTKNNQYGEMAVQGYLHEFEKQFDTEHWVNCYDHIQSAYQIAHVIGTKSECFKQTRKVINQKILQMNGTDSLFLSLSLIGLIMRDAPKEDLKSYDTIVCIIADRNFDFDNSNSNLADATYEVLKKLYARMKKNEELKIFKARYAGYYEAQAKLLAQKEDFFRAVIMLKKACILYIGIDQDKLLELRLLLENWQKKALKEMHVHEYKFDVKPIYNAVEKMFEGLSLTEAIVQFGRIATIYNVDDVKNKLRENQEEYIFTSMFGSSLLNEQGQSVQELPPLSGAIDFCDLDLMKQHMVRYVAEQRRLYDAIPVGMAGQLLSKYGSITESDLDFLVNDNAIVPEGREEIIKQGLCLGLSGKMYAAMHILQPQTENIFRNLVKMCGDTVTFLKNDGSEQYKPLSSLFRSEKLRECYDENIIFTFQSIMDEPAGENLRNLNSHGLLEPDAGNSTTSLYFIGLLVCLLSLYAPKARSIRIALAKREQIEVNANNE